MLLKSGTNVFNIIIIKSTDCIIKNKQTNRNSIGDGCNIMNTEINLNDYDYCSILLLILKIMIMTFVCLEKEHIIVWLRMSRLLA